MNKTEREEWWGRVDRLIKVILAPIPGIIMGYYLIVSGSWLVFPPLIFAAWVILSIVSGVLLITLFYAVRVVCELAATAIYIWHGAAE
jgi:hypothetical protein